MSSPLLVDLCDHWSKQGRQSAAGRKPRTQRSGDPTHLNRTSTPASTAKASRPHSKSLVGIPSRLLGIGPARERRRLSQSRRAHLSRPVAAPRKLSGGNLPKVRSPANNHGLTEYRCCVVTPPLQAGLVLGGNGVAELRLPPPSQQDLIVPGSAPGLTQ